MTKLFFTLSVLVFLSLNTFAKNHIPEKYVICKNRNIVRTIHIEKNDESKTCETKYTKAGVDRIVGKGQTVLGCDKILSNIQDNLEEAHWKCRQVKGVKISQLSTSED